MEPSLLDKECKVAICGWDYPQDWLRVTGGPKIDPPRGGSGSWQQDLRNASVIDVPAERLREIAGIMSGYDLVIIPNFGNTLMWMDAFVGCDAYDIYRQSNSRLVYWSFDTHVPDHHDYEEEYSAKFDAIYTAHSKFARYPHQQLDCCVWGNSAEALNLKARSMSTSQKRGVSFLRRRKDRDSLWHSIELELAKRDVPHVGGSVFPAKDYLDLLGSYRVAFNASEAGELNMRCFEGWAMGCNVVTDSELADRDGTFLFNRGNAESAVNSIMEALASQTFPETRWKTLGNDLLIHRYVKIINDQLGLNLRYEYTD